MKVHHVAIQVGDLAKARAFYVSLLGLPLIKEQPHSLWVQAGEAIVMLEKGADVVEGTPWADPRPGPFCVSFAIAPGERAPLVARLTAAGVAVDHESGFTVYVRDPWGARLGFSHYPLAREG